jgi:hypothetical protein
MIKKIISTLVLLLALSSCSKEFHESDLLMPPNFNKMLIINAKNTENDNKVSKKLKNKVSKEDVSDIKKLLLE